jgi:predicted RNA-binding Zn-ribbon protein involved in translation (DUF1610 family)
MARLQYWFTVTLGHSCSWCHHWIRIGERAHYYSSGDCGIIQCESCTNRA